MNKCLRLSSEAVVSRHYIDWIISLPWKKVSKDTISLPQAEKILNKKHAGLIKAKERIIEFLAAKKFSKNLTRSPIICLVGPPGVGKTSLAQSIADSSRYENLYAFPLVAYVMKQKFVAIAAPISVHYRVKLFKQ